MFWKKKYDLYLAGGMRGYKDLNKPLFALAARLLRKQGFTVWSPSEHKSYLQLSFAQVISIDLNKVINNCRGIALLPGWRESLGANIEAFTAFVCGKEAMEVNIFTSDRDTDPTYFGSSVHNDSVTLTTVHLAKYSLPYAETETVSFDPHRCVSTKSFDIK